MNLRRFVATLVLASAAIAHAQTMPTTSPMETNLDAELAAIDAKAATIEDLVADFEQQKHSALLTEPIITRGEVRAKNNAMLWIGTTPQPTRMRVSLSRMQIYYVSQKTVEDYPIVGKLGSLAASPLPRLATLRERFTITRDTGDGLTVGEAQHSLVVRLMPIEDEVKQYVDHIRVRLNADRGVVETFELTDPDGENTTINFTRMRTNSHLDDKALDLGAPSDVKVVKPLEPGK